LGHSFSGQIGAKILKIAVLDIGIERAIVRAVNRSNHQQETTMTLLQRFACCAILISLAAVNGYAQGNSVNGYTINARVFNDNPGSTLTITPASPINANPATITIRDEWTTAAGFANRHDLLASADGGVTAYIHSIDHSFTFTTMLTLTDGFNSPRKEAGIRINSPITGDALFIVNSDAGEIVTFGGGAPFHSFGSNGGGNGYTPGNSILLGITHIAGGDGAGGIANTIEFFINRGAGIETTGPRPWENAEAGPVTFQVGVYLQGQTSVDGDFANALFSDTTYTVVPEPGTFALVGLGLIGLWAFRRKK
jgi:hypothetical protein